MLDPEKMSRKELVSEHRHLVREQEEYEAKLARERERAGKYQGIVYEVCNTLDRLSGRLVTRGEGVTVDEVISAIVAISRERDQLYRLLSHADAATSAWRGKAGEREERIAELEAMLNHHGPNGRNVTNAQHVALRERMAELERVATHLAVTLRSHSNNATKRYHLEVLGRDVEIADDDGHCCMEMCCEVGDSLHDLLDALGIGEDDDSE